ncbi:Glycosyl transferase, family 2 [Sterolibacterium denitrificans]|uniref:Glycosyl transferase, family 2 n=1 Tax=Sterolibacterium denitrificans TaxID=157592 RepID=A0A7Z7HQ85_9PROT|nr:glycosyltransferase [Sterolibacterium denitrificans]SMB24533.1 Glycosyl transferase, family 2 [Sterolibacterium denitrificans]
MGLRRLSASEIGQTGWVPGDSSSKFRFSLVIATLQDDGELECCLASMPAPADGPDFEVVVVDQNGDGRLDDVVRRHAENLEIVHVRVDFRGLNRARNVGARVARGEWLGFPDDDCQLFPDTLLALERLIADPTVGVATGRTVDTSGASSVLRWRRQSCDFGRWTMFGCLTEAVFFVQRSVFMRAGGFDERFGPGAAFPAAEGIELMDRLFALMENRRACYDPAIRMRHPQKVPPWNRWAAARFHAYAIGAGAVVAKRPSPHLIYWGARIVAGALARALFSRGWKRAAYAARARGFFTGLLRGTRVFYFAEWRNCAR